MDERRLLQIVLANVVPGQEHNFDKTDVIQMAPGTSYDFGSIMHYGKVSLIYCSGNIR